MKNSFRFFENRDCIYYPCHGQQESINCMFCYCPLYSHKACPGEYSYIEADGRKIKDCSACTFPHRAENYDAVIALLSEK